LLKFHNHFIIVKEIIITLIKKIIYSQKRTIIAIYSLLIIIAIYSLKQIIIEIYSLSIFSAIYSLKQIIIVKKITNYCYCKFVNRLIMLRIIVFFYAIIVLNLYLELIKN